MYSAVVTDDILPHEGQEMVHGGIHTLLNPGHCQVAAIEETMTTGKFVLIKIGLK